MMLALALLLGSPAGAAPKAPAAPAPAMPATPAPVSMTEDERASLFGGWATALGTGNREAAAEALITILHDETKAPAHGEAWGRLADLLDQMGYPMAAVGAYGRAFTLDAPRNAPSLEKAIALTEKVHDDGPLAEALSKNVGIPAEGATKNQMVSMAARTQLEHDEVGLALAILALGDSSAPGFEDVSMLHGIVLAQQQRYGDAIEPLQIAQTAGVQHKRGEEFANLAALNLGRAYYADGNYGLAIASNASVSRASPHWLEAQFERAWAHFRGNDMNGALAMLFNLDAPFFEDDFHPEADLLRAYSLFIMCKFTDATAEINAFQARYEPMNAQLASVSMSPEEAYADAAAFVAGGEQHKLPTWVLDPFRTDQRFLEGIDAAAFADAELARVDQLPGELATVAKNLVTAQRAARVRSEGQRVLDRVDDARSQMTSMLAGIEITRLDLLNLESQMYSRAAATGVLDYGNRAEKLRDLRKRKTGFQVWPFEGEYWADELGWYVFDARPDCPESMARGADGAN
jgi:tetratricopeptide (TPR) repeat protein